ncbi:MAG TPA: NtaA/DmoA family FMN-dependent monooxygenase [Pseudolysinimonas sp.]|nr:NtaA/DmoA family FMN-dependent monooxygenase [Pseudolysinimonas sp.]
MTSNEGHSVVPFALGLLHSFTPPAWLSTDDRLHGGDWWNGRYFVETAQRLEAACLDFMFFHDTQAVQRRADGSMAPALRWAATAPAHDPLVLLPILAYETRHIGLIGTASTTFNNPYQLARTFGTLDNIANGRIGWNIVTSYESDAALNFGMDALPGRENRYDRADDFLDVTSKLWTAWEPDAVIADLETDTYVDGSKVHDVNHEGPFYKSKGPLNVMRSPQGVPYLAQAGASERGREFAAQHAEMVFSIAAGSIDEAREFRDDIRARAAAHGRDPDDIKVVYGCNVTFLPDDWDPNEPLPVTAAQFGSQLEWYSSALGIDLSLFPLDEPFPADTPPPTAAIRTMFDMLVETGKNGMTLREAITAATKPRNPAGFRGTPEQVAEQMIEFMAGVGGDGIMISREWDYNALFLDNLTERLVPALQRAGATRTDYVEGATLRESMRGPRV